MERKLNQKAGKFNSKISNIMSVFTKTIKDIEEVNKELVKEKQTSEDYAEQLSNHSNVIGEMIKQNNIFINNINKLFN